jgi:transcription termination/antitermination protein NusA
MPSEEAEWVVHLFAQEVPEVAHGVVEIKALARKPGFRTKVAVLSHDPNVDPIDACVGIRGFRIKNMVNQIGGSERIDLVRWVESPEQLICNALQPATIDAVILDYPNHRARVVVSGDQLSLAEGRDGLNRELASRLCAWEIEVAKGPSPDDISTAPPA